MQRKIDPEDARAYLLTLKPQGALRLARNRRPGSTAERFEGEIGKSAHAELLRSLRKLNCVPQPDKATPELQY